MKIKDLIEHLDRRFLPSCQESYDNAGFLVGNPDNELTNVLVTIDVTPAVVEEALQRNANLIVSHHPLIFNGLKQLTPANDTSRMVMRLIAEGICVYAAHTNLDNLDWGVNGILAERLGLANCHILRPLDDHTELGAGMVGELPHPTPAADFLATVKETLRLPVIRVSQNYHSPQFLGTHSPIKRVAICGGSGSFLIDDAKACGADLFMTADLKYHDFQKAENELLIADIGHFESEQFAKDIFYSVISEKISNFACLKSEKDTGYILYI